LLANKRDADLRHCPVSGPEVLFKTCVAMKLVDDDDDDDWFYALLTEQK